MEQLSEAVAFSQRQNISQENDLDKMDLAVDERLMALENLLANPNFKASDRNRRFLKFVVDETVAGRADRIKAFTIAVDVFGRDASFDATVDPIVRIAAGQLRKSLRDYYDNLGKTDAIRIGMPLGAYVPSFEKTSGSERFWCQFVGALRFLQKRLMSVAMIALSGGLLLGGFYATARLKSNDGVFGKPVVVVDSARASSGEVDRAGLSRQLNNALWVEFARHQGIRLVGVRGDENLDTVVASIRGTLDSGTRIYKLITTLQQEGDALDVYWHLVDANSRETYYSSHLTATVPTGDRARTIGKIAESVESSLFRYGGVMERYSSKAGVLANSRRN